MSGSRVATEQVKLRGLPDSPLGWFRKGQACGAGGRVPGGKVGGGLAPRPWGANGARAPRTGPLGRSRPRAWQAPPRNSAGPHPSHGVRGERARRGRDSPLPRQARQVLGSGHCAMEDSKSAIPGPVQPPRLKPGKLPRAGARPDEARELPEGQEPSSPHGPSRTRPEAKSPPHPEGPEGYSAKDAVPRRGGSAREQPRHRPGECLDSPASTQREGEPRRSELRGGRRGQLPEARPPSLAASRSLTGADPP